MRASARSRARRAALPRGRRTPAFVIGLGLVLSGCLLSASPEEPSPVPLDPHPPAEEDRSDAAAPPGSESPVPAEVTRLLDDGDWHLAAGSYERAAGAYRGVLAQSHPMEWDPTGEIRARTYFSLAVAHLLSDEPEDKAHARRYFRTLEDAYASTLQGVVARWVGGVLDELDRAHDRIAEREALIDQLTETLEQLKRIDLNRRPGGGSAAPIRRDTVPQPRR